MDDEFLSFAFSLVAIAAFLGLVVIATVVGFMLLPFIAAVVFALGGIYYYHSPPYLERKAKEHTEALYAQVKHLAAPDRDQYLRSVYEAIGADGDMLACADALYELEGFEQIPPPPPVANSLEGARYRDRLSTFAAKAHDSSEYDRFQRAVIEILSQLKPTKQQGAFEVTLPLTNEEIENLAVSFFKYENLFVDVRKRLDENYAEAKVLPTEYKGENPAWTYFKDTPLLLLAERRELISLGNRFEHQYILAQTGHGKTTLLEYLISRDLEEDCCVVVIDSQRQLISKLAKLDVAADDIAWISPRNPLALNLFAFADSSNATIELLKFVLGSLFDAPLTAKQDVIFNFTIQMMLAIPGANIRTFRQLLHDPAPLSEHFGRLDPTTREFFDREFQNREYDATKREIAWRIWSMQKNPVFARMFDATENRVNMREEMQRRLVLLDTDANLLHGGSRFLGRLCLAMILQEAERRDVGKHRPVYLYLDEAHDIVDENVDRMLAQARKGSIGITLAHQYLAQIKDPAIRQGILVNTVAKFAGSGEAGDAKALAANLRTTAEFIQAQKKGAFALYVKGETDRAVSAQVPFGALRKFEAGYTSDRLTEIMTGRYGPTREPEPPPQSEPVAGEGFTMHDAEEPASADEDMEPKPW